MKKWYPTRKTMKIMGRTLVPERVEGRFAGTERYLCHSASYVEFYFTGTTLSCEILSDYEEPRDAGFQCYMELSVDGAPVRRFALRGGRARYALLNGKYRERARVRLMKITEEQYTSAAICFFETEEGAILSPTPYAERRIEVVGDSITCGFGNEGRPEQEFTTVTENAAKSYGVLCAQEFGADFQLVSYSGIGVISRNVEPDVDEPLTDLLAPELYAETDPQLRDRNGWPAKPWDFAQFRPDVVVVNLGTNDASYTRGIPERTAHFAREYRAFLETVRRCNPQAVIVCTLGAMDERLVDCAEKVVGELREVWRKQGAGKLEAVEQRAEEPELLAVEQGTGAPELLAVKQGAGELGLLAVEQANKARIFFYRERRLAPEETGCSGHPSVIGDRRMARELAAFLRQIHAFS